MGDTRHGLTQGWWCALVSLMAAGSPVAAQPDLPPEFSVQAVPAGPELPAFSPWDTVFTFQSSAGWKDNVSLSALRRESSPLLRQLAEVIVFRVPVDGLEFNAYVSAEDTRYLARTVVDKEQHLLAHAQLKRAWNADWSTSLTGQYLYQNQVVDLSTSLATPTVLAVESHLYAARLGVRRRFAERWWAEVEPSLARQDFNSPLDDYWEGGPKLTVGTVPGRGAELTFSYELNHRVHDRREQLDRTGAALPGSELVFTQHRAQVAWKQDWDAARQWRTTTRLGHDYSQDNGPGYFDFRAWRVSQQVRWMAAPWELSVTGRFATFDYPFQPVGPADPRSLERTSYAFNFRAERAVTKRVKWFVDYDLERLLSNQAATGYLVNLFHSGFIVEF